MIIYVSHNWWIQMHTLFARPRHWSRSYLHRPGDLVYNNVIPPTMVQQWSLSYQYANFRCFLGHIMRDTEILVGGIPTPLKNMSNQLGISWQWEISNHNRGDIISWFNNQTPNMVQQSRKNGGNYCDFTSNTCSTSNGWCYDGTLWILEF